MDATVTAALPPVREIAEESLMHAEAAEGPAMIRRQLRNNAEDIRALAAKLRNTPPRYVLTCGRGSSSNAATYARYILGSELGLVAAPIPPSIASVYNSHRNMEGALFVAISQSGQSPDILENAQAAKRGGAHVLALVNHVDSPLARMADTVLPLHVGNERSVAATKTYLATLSTILQLTAYWKEDEDLLSSLEQLPDAMELAWNADWSELRDGLREQRSLLVVGRGVGFATALEAALKLKETCGLHAEAFSAAEIKHGPVALVDNAIPLLIFAQADRTEAGSVSLTREMRARGAKVWTVGIPDDAGSTALPSTSTHPLLAPFVHGMSFYRVANGLSFDRGLHPDRPPNLQKVTCTL